MLPFSSTSSGAAESQSGSRPLRAERRRRLDAERRGYRVAKRIIDLAAAFGGLIITSPVLLVLGIAVRRRLGAPILFRQQRPGLHERTFELVKFRTMTDAHGDDGELLPDADRLTPVGRWLRRTSLDELPTLWNVLRGDMSVVGPRPLLMRYLPRYSEEQARRHDVKPGVTGWTQIHGRNALSWDKKFALDVWYVDHQSLSLDLKILVATLRAVLSQSGVSAEGHVTMPEFLGASGD